MMQKMNCTICNIEFIYKNEPTRHSIKPRKYCSQGCMGSGYKIKFTYDHVFKSFENKVIKTDECWQWRGNLDKDKYGTFGALNKTFKAHRISWMIHNGEIPNNYFVLHRCDNPTCSNPSHLFLGTSKDNYHDMMKKGRRVAAKGERASNAKLANDDVHKIRRLLKSGLSIKNTAHEFKVSQRCIRSIINKENWAHLPETID